MVPQKRGRSRHSRGFWVLCPARLPWLTIFAVSLTNLKEAPWTAPARIYPGTGAFSLLAKLVACGPFPLCGTDRSCRLTERTTARKIRARRTLDARRTLRHPDRRSRPVRHRRRLSPAAEVPGQELRHPGGARRHWRDLGPV